MQTTIGANVDKTRIITLTDQPPVSIKESEWPIISNGLYFKATNDQPHLALTEKVDIRVRRHDDGRTLVYGIYRYEHPYFTKESENDVNIRAGYLLKDGEDVVEAINSVGIALTDLWLEEGYKERKAKIFTAVRECIENLPTTEI